MGLMNSISEETNMLFGNIRLTLASVFMGFWIYLMGVWSKHDKKVVRFFLLFFFSALYTWFYFLFAKERGWILPKREKQN